MSPSRGLGGAALPLLFSFSAHGLAVLALYAWCGGRGEAGPALHVTVDTVALWVEDPAPQGTAPQPDEPPGPAETEFLVSVADSASPPDPAPLVAAAPVLITGPAGGEGEPAEPSHGGAGGGTGQGRDLFPVPATARTVVYVLDRSLSMWEHGTLDPARTELLASLWRLPAATRFQVIPYNLQAEPLRVNQSSDLLPADPATLRQVAKLVMELQASGNTNHGQALRRGLRFRPDVLYFITDADDISLEEVAGVTRLNQGRSVIHAVELSERRSPRQDSPLRRLAGSNGGTYRQVTSRE
jgi:hypothetical protein